MWEEGRTLQRKVKKKVPCEIGENVGRVHETEQRVVCWGGGLQRKNEIRKVSGKWYPLDEVVRGGILVQGNLIEKESGAEKEIT